MNIYTCIKAKNQSQEISNISYFPMYYRIMNILILMKFLISIWAFKKLSSGSLKILSLILRKPVLRTITPIYQVWNYFTNKMYFLYTSF